MKKELFVDGWQFAKQGEEKQAVELPHDAMLLEKRDPDCAGGSACAFFPGAVYEYEKRFTAPREWKDQQVWIQFEGVYQKSSVYLNDEKVGECAYGYRPFFVALTQQIKIGEENLLRVVADNSSQPNSRWYSGGGIYRNVWLWTGDRASIAPEGMKITTLSVKPARVRVETVLLEDSPENSVQVEIFDRDRKVADGTGNSAELEILDAKLWSEQHPDLYRCRVSLYRGEELLETREEFFGIRLVECSAKGLFVNGEETLLRGGCVHHDNGILGSASYLESEWRKVKKLKDAGYNAIRSSHYPASPALLDACDALGMYVMDETWDMWYKHKNPYDYASEFMDCYRDDIKAIVDRDYNHPSVIMYSIGNEVSEPAQERGVELAEEMTALFHELDPGKIVTGGMNLMIISRSAGGNDIYDEEKGLDTSSQKKTEGMNSTLFNMLTSMVGTSMNKGANGKKADQVTSPVLDALDLAGYNYASGRYPMEGKAHPGRVVVGSETFPQDIAKNWEMVEKYPYLVGDFMWTAWDYLGEAGIGAWAYDADGKGFNKPYPWMLADVGAMDILGNPNGELFLAQAVWNQGMLPKIAVQPANHPGVKPAKAVWRGTNAIPVWSWKGCEGNKTVVEVYAQGAAAELYLNGKKLGKKKLKGGCASFKVKYEPGVLKAVIYDAAGHPLAETELRSAQGATQLLLQREETAVAADFYGPEYQEQPEELVYVDLSLVGENGILQANDDRKLNAEVENGTLLGFGSAVPRTEESYLDSSFGTYYGKAQAVVKKKKGQQARLRVWGDGLEGRIDL